MRLWPFQLLDDSEREGTEFEMEPHSQDVADDADRPHVRAVADRLEVDHFGRDELRRAEQDLQLLGRVVASRQAEVDELDPVALASQAQNVLRLRNKVNVTRQPPKPARAATSVATTFMSR